ncbi:mechanosensitive ion channel family protein [Melioribacter sp. OK-6-Me]|uniref:mechanosensitive ion channel family protein n=1 Tax=unclassified Melioribacter TaxID=2627329 RepID=UPI003EDA1BF4
MFFKKEFLGNTIEDYLIALGVFLVIFIIIRIIKKFVLQRLKKQLESSYISKYNFLNKSINKFFVPAIYLGILYLIIERLKLSNDTEKIIVSIYLVLITYFVVRFSVVVVKYLIERYFIKSNRESDFNRIQPLLGLVDLVIWAVGIIFLLDNFGFEVSAVITGLGISGVAVALAAQAILGDLFSYFVLFFDKPFEVGDFINFEGQLGNIEKIGLKTTKIRALSGEQLIVNNSRLTTSTVHNFKRMEKRRVVLRIGVVYQTPHDKLIAIPTMIKEIISRHELVQYDRGHFVSYGDFSLNFEFVYFILSPEMELYLDIQQSINLEIFRLFEQEGIEFAYPTQTIFVNQENSTNSGNNQ